MDLTAEFYIETVEKVFQKHALPLGSKWRLSGRPVHLPASDPRYRADDRLKVKSDDITGRGQTHAAYGSLREPR